MLPYSFIGTGTYTNPATPVAVNVALSDAPDWFFVRDITVSVTSAFLGWGGNNATDYTANAQISSEWFSAMAPGSFLQTGQAANAIGAAALYPTQGTTGGFTFIDSSNPPTYAALAASAIDKTTWIVSMSNTGSIAVGDWVRVLNPVGMLEANGIVAQVTAVTTNTSITLGYVASAVSAGLSFAANASSASILKIWPSQFYPKSQQVLYVTQANQAVVYFAKPNDYTPGELVDFSIPVAYGMTQLSYLTGLPGGPARVLSVTNSATVSSITIAVNTTGYTAFIYPVTASYLTTASPPICVPAGSGLVPLNGSATVPLSPPQTNLQDAFDCRRQYYMNLGTNVCGRGGATMVWVAMRADYNGLSNA
jgi:hypothetical protein